MDRTNARLNADGSTTMHAQCMLNGNGSTPSSMRKRKPRRRKAMPNADGSTTSSKRSGNTEKNAKNAEFNARRRDEASATIVTTLRFRSRA